LRYGYLFRRIPLTQGKFAIVDPADFPHLAKYNWRLCTGNNTFYAERSIRLPTGRYSRILMHREVLSLHALPVPPVLSIAEGSKVEGSRVEVSKGQLFENLPLFSTTQNSKPRTQNYHRCLSDGYVIDHINRNGLDNRRSNLRFATIAQNAWNSRRRKNRSGYKGVWYAKDKGRFRAAIWHNNKREYLGYFNSKIDAALEYDRAAKKYHGDFASLNFD